MPLDEPSRERECTVYERLGEPGQCRRRVEQRVTDGSVVGANGNTSKATAPRRFGSGRPSHPLGAPLSSG